LRRVIWPSCRTITSRTAARRADLAQIANRTGYAPPIAFASAEVKWLQNVAREG
jgi:hypothetical protein